MSMDKVHIGDLTVTAIYGQTSANECGYDYLLNYEDKFSLIISEEAMKQIVELYNKYHTKEGSVYRVEKWSMSDKRNSGFWGGFKSYMGPKLANEKHFKTMEEAEECFEEWFSKAEAGQIIQLVQTYEG